MNGQQAAIDILVEQRNSLFSYEKGNVDHCNLDWTKLQRWDYAWFKLNWRRLVHFGAVLRSVIGPQAPRLVALQLVSSLALLSGITHATCPCYIGLVIGVNFSSTLVVYYHPRRSVEIIVVHVKQHTG